LARFSRTARALNSPARPYRSGPVRAPAEDLSIRNVLAGTVAGIDADRGPFCRRVHKSRRARPSLRPEAIDELKIGPGNRVFALIMTVALDKRAAAAIEP